MLTGCVFEGGGKGENTRLCFDRKLYSKEAFMKAAFSFIDRAYIQLRQDEGNYIMDAVRKEGTDVSDEQLAAEIANEMLAQVVRQSVYERTRDLRELILARALASSVIGTVHVSNEARRGSEGIDSILTDWFEQNGH